jgi:hypothetical protein
MRQTWLVAARRSRRGRSALHVAPADARAVAAAIALPALLDTARHQGRGAHRATPAEYRRREPRSAVDTTIRIHHYGTCRGRSRRATAIDVLVVDARSSIGASAPTNGSRQS